MASRLTKHKPLLWQLYIEKNLTAKQIAKYMHEEHQLKCSEGVYQRAFKKWGFKKYCDGSDWVWVDKKQREREALGKKTQFTFNDRVMDDAKIQKEISRNVSSLQQMTTVTTPGTPNGWTAITLTASTPDYELRGSHFPYGESPVEQEANADTLSAADNSNHGSAVNIDLARQVDVDVDIKFLEQTLLKYLTISDTLAGPPLIAMQDEAMAVVSKIANGLSVRAVSKVINPVVMMAKLMITIKVALTAESVIIHEITAHLTPDHIILTAVCIIDNYKVTYEVKRERVRASTRHTQTEESSSSPYLYSRWFWTSESLDLFYDRQSSGPRRASISQTPTLASSPDTEIDMWADPQMPEPIF